MEAFASQKYKKAITRVILVSGIILLISTILGIYFLKGRDMTATWHAVLVNYLFFTSGAAGLVVWPAIVMVSHGKWMGSLERLCYTGFSFAIPSLAALVLLWRVSPQWAPWLTSTKPWLDNTFLFSRNIILQGLFWLVSLGLLLNRQKNHKTVWAAMLILVYAVTFSVAGFDFVMALDPKWHSMMMGGYFFISGLYIAAALWAFMASVFMSTAEKSGLYDIGNLLIAFCMLTSYLMFSQLLPIWYENLPDETRFLVPRMNFDWKYISILLLALVYLGPVALLLNRRVKENRIYMGIISLAILAGMWIERWWLVSAVIHKHRIVFGMSEILVVLVFFSLFITGIFLMLRILPEYNPPKRAEA